MNTNYDESHEMRHWKTFVVQLEQQMMDGNLPDVSLHEIIPDAVKLSSPLLLQAECFARITKGNYQKAQDLLALSVKAYAMQGNAHEMRTAIAMMALLYIRMGEVHESALLIDFLQQEERRSPDTCSGFVLWAIARRPNTEANEIQYASALENDHYYLKAAEKFSKEATPIWFVNLMMDRWIYDSHSIKGGNWDYWVLRLRQLSAMYPVCKQAYDVIANLRFDQSEQMHLPYRYRFIARELLHPGSGLPSPELAYDLEVQLFGVRAEINLALHDKGEEARVQLLRKAELLCYAIGSPASWRWLASLRQVVGLGATGETGETVRETKQSATMLNEWKPIIYQGLPEAHSTPKADKPNIKLMDRIRFIVGRQERDAKWKRRKSKELFVYLLMQEGFRASRQTLTAEVFGEGEEAKLTNQLYVAMHELRQTLRENGLDNVLYARGGIVGLEEQRIGSVDLNEYLAFGDTGDSLWTDEELQATSYYRKAAGIYGVVGAEFKEATWLKKVRSELLERQTRMLKRLAYHCLAAGDAEEAEQWLKEWIAISPAQEEAYQDLLRLLKSSGRISDAVDWYRRLEKVCAAEQNRKPLDETRMLIQE
ncbi:hypothetical protein EBB07_27090 [Paenibacillaceae bacterium]|nr:hypothetical protein EBB07_27090 [Paenibacillaceae bacterium]